MLLKEPRRIRLRAISLNHRSTRLSHDELVTRSVAESTDYSWTTKLLDYRACAATSYLISLNPSERGHGFRSSARNQTLYGVFGRKDMRFESSTEINATPERIWATLSDPEEWPRWIPSLKKIEKLSTGPLGVGSQFRITARASITVGLSMKITEFVPGERVVMQGKVLGTKLTRYYSLTSINGHTRVTAGGEASGWLACLISRGGQALSEEIVQSFKKKIEG